MKIRSYDLIVGKKKIEVDGGLIWVHERQKYLIIEDKHFTASVEKMEGMDTIWSFNADENTKFDIEITISEGEFEKLG